MYRFLLNEYWEPELGCGRKTLSGLKEINILGKSRSKSSYRCCLGKNLTEFLFKFVESDSQ